MITISANGDPITLTKTTLLSDYLASLPNPSETATGTVFAVAINGEFVPRSQYATTQLQQGDELDVVSPVGGG